MKHSSKIIGIVLVGVVILVAIDVALFNPLDSNAPNEPVLPPQDRALLLYCGAGIQPVAEAVIEAFRVKSDITVNSTYAGRGRLLGQLASSQVGNLFMPGSAFDVDRAIERKLAHKDTKQMKHIDAAIMWDANARQFASAVDIIDIPVEQNLVSTIPVITGDKVTS